MPGSCIMNPTGPAPCLTITLGCRLFLTLSRSLTRFLPTQIQPPCSEAYSLLWIHWALSQWKWPLKQKDSRKSLNLAWLEAGGYAKNCMLAVLTHMPVHLLWATVRDRIRGKVTPRLITKFLEKKSWKIIVNLHYSPYSRKKTPNSFAHISHDFQALRPALMAAMAILVFLCKMTSSSLQCVWGKTAAGGTRLLKSMA